MSSDDPAAPAAAAAAPLGMSSLQVRILFFMGLSLLSNFSGELLPCDIQKVFDTNMYAKHLLGAMLMLFFNRMTRAATMTRAMATRTARTRAMARTRRKKTRNGLSTRIGPGAACPAPRGGRSGSRGPPPRDTAARRWRGGGWAGRTPPAPACF